MGPIELMIIYYLELLALALGVAGYEDYKKNGFSSKIKGKDIVTIGKILLYGWTIPLRCFLSAVVAEIRGDPEPMLPPGSQTKQLTER